MKKHLGLGIGLMVASVAALGVGLVANHYGSWGQDYVKTELTAQKITMPAEDRFPENPDPCLAKFASTKDVPNMMDTGEEAQCYANSYILVHMHESTVEAGVEGATYGSINSMQPVVDAKAAVTDAQKALDDAIAAGETDTEDLEAALDEAKAEAKVYSDLRTSLMNGSFLRGALLTTYGFSVFAELGVMAGTILFVLAGLLFVLGLVFVAMPAPKAKA